MKRVLFVILSLLFLVNSVSAYGLILKCPDQVSGGTPIKCTLDSDFPPGTPYTIIFSGPGQSHSESELIPSKYATQYKVFGTEGLKAGTYSIDIIFNGSTRLRSDSVTNQKILITSSGSESVTPASTMTSLTTVPSQVKTPIITMVPTISQVGNSTTRTKDIPTTIISKVPTISIESLIIEQNKKIDAQNTLIAEQNQKLSDQNNLLGQIIGSLKSIFGLK